MKIVPFFTLYPLSENEFEKFNIYVSQGYRIHKAVFSPQPELTPAKAEPSTKYEKYLIHVLIYERCSLTHLLFSGSNKATTFLLNSIIIYL